MTEYLRYLRSQLAKRGVKPADIDAIETETVGHWGGAKIYIARRQTTAQREQVNRLIASGVSPRTARWKVRGK